MPWYVRPSQDVVTSQLAIARGGLCLRPLRTKVTRFYAAHQRRD